MLARGARAAQRGGRSCVLLGLAETVVSAGTGAHAPRSFLTLRLSACTFLS